MEYEIVHLPKEKWKGTVIPIEYTTDTYYDVIVYKTDKGFTVIIEKKHFPEPVTHTQEENNFPDKLYEDYRKDEQPTLKYYDSIPSKRKYRAKL